MKKMAFITLMAALVAVFTIMLAPATASAQSIPVACTNSTKDQKCLARCLLRDDAVKESCCNACGSAGPDCPAGTHLSGGKCVPNEQTNCPAGTHRVGTQCVPNQQTKCPPGTVLKGGRCVPAGGGKLVCDEKLHQQINADKTACECMTDYEHWSTDKGAEAELNCVEKCKDGEKRDDADGVCKPAGVCDNPCFTDLNAKLDAAKTDVVNAVNTGNGDESWWLKVIAIATITGFSLNTVFWLMLLFGFKEWYAKRREAKRQEKEQLARIRQQQGGQAAPAQGQAPPPLPAQPVVAQPVAQPAAQPVVAQPVAQPAAQPTGSPLGPVGAQQAPASTGQPGPKS